MLFKTNKTFRIRNEPSEFPPRCLSSREFASHDEDRGSNPGRDRPKSLKQVVTAPLLSARQEVRASRVLGDDHYKRMTRVTVGVARLRTFIDQCQWVPSTGQNLKPFTGNGDISI